MTEGGLSFLEPVSDLRSQEAYLRLLNAMPVMLWTADAQGRWQHVNRHWSIYTGLLGETQGFGFEEALHPADRAPTLARWRQAVRSGQDYEIEYRLRSRRGDYHWFLIRGVQVRDDLGTGVAWVGTCTDIEPQKRAEQDTLATREAALRALALALEVRDRETSTHTERVTVLAVQLGTALGLLPEALGHLRLGASLHDLGKVAVPGRILHKPGALTEDERREMQRHSAEGERLAAALEFVPPPALQLVRHHHEHWNGRDYPDQLCGEAIPYLARLFAVIDVYDALRSERPYKAAWTREQALTELCAQAGEQLDPHMVEVFTRLVEEDALAS
ncbi:HD domain-containing phosphohydrolase [Deinococcus sp. Leaf326]|uniref:HD domain-containing phosphohydrolase n=1 Tax=Deinococcus sp. Leaf326 TaxID=1736338 RepID=UPI0006FE65A6|nr:HD domain-containing phosphohydrolase [Deinococcus sp. Leaf326]KQR41031.1 histidine kinase [Deinococcus sp. Leaf326]